jgi:hypothetical protein
MNSKEQTSKTTQTNSKERRGIRLILLGPPGSGKGLSLLFSSLLFFSSNQFIAFYSFFFSFLVYCLVALSVSFSIHN